MKKDPTQNEPRTVYKLIAATGDADFEILALDFILTWLKGCDQD